MGVLRNGLLLTCGTRSLLIAILGVACVAACIPATTPLEPSPLVVAATVPPARVDEAVRVRLLWGLRADTNYVEAVEGDDASVERGAKVGWGIALTAPEVAQIGNRELRSQVTMQTLERYGAEHPNEWAGLSIDESQAGTMTVRFSGRIDEHEAAIRRIVRPDAIVEVLLVDWPLAELQALADRVRDERDKIVAIGATYVGGGVDIRSNRALIDVRSADPNIGPRVIDLFAADGQMEVRVDAPAWDGGAGTLAIAITDSEGAPVPGLLCELFPDDPRALPDGGSGVPSGDDGTCHEAGGATGYEVRILDPATLDVLATRRTRIVRGRQVVLEVSIPTRP